MVAEVEVALAFLPAAEAPLGEWVACLEVAGEANNSRAASHFKSPILVRIPIARTLFSNFASCLCLKLRLVSVPILFGVGILD